MDIKSAWDWQLDPRRSKGKRLCRLGRQKRGSKRKAKKDIPEALPQVESSIEPCAKTPQAVPWLDQRLEL
jgi:hypothetical protein